MATFGPTTPNPEKAPAARRATFFGTAFHKVSGRNQVAIPRAMIKALEAADEGQLLLMRLGQEGFLRIYTQEQLDSKIDEIRNNEKLDAQTRNELVRRLARNAVPFEPDAQGRFVLPANWVQELSLSDEVAFCGAFNWIEIWPAAARRDVEAQENENSAGTDKLLGEMLNG